MNLRKLLKNTAAVSLAAIVASSAVCLPVLAAERTEQKYITKYVIPNNKSFIENNRDLIEEIAEGLFAHKTEIDIFDARIPKEYAGAVFDAVLSIYPETFFVDRNIPFSYRTVDGNQYITKLNPKYLYNKSDTDRMLAEFYKEADSYLERVNDKLAGCKDDFSKAMLLHDEIVLDAYYKIDDRSSYTFMMEKYGVCENYSRVYAYLLSQIGIYSEVVDSQDMNHEWLKICIDGQYYNVDITWDDALPDKPGKAGHDFFLLSDSKIKQQINGNAHYSYESVNSAGNTKYDNALYHSYTSKLCVISGNMYAVDSEGKRIVKYDYNNDKATTLLSIDHKWSAGGTSYWLKNYSGLDSYNGLLYYNTSDTIYSLDPATKKSTEVYVNSGSKDIYGLRISGGKLYAILASNPNETGEVVYLRDLSSGNSVSKTNISSAQVTVANRTYTGKALTPEPKVVLGGKTLVKGTDYTVTYSNNVNVGKATVKITGKGNYSGTTTANFTINKANIAKYTVSLSATSYTYTGTQRKPAVTVKNGSAELTNGTDYTVTYSNNINKGTATVKITGKGNYSGTISQKFTIKAKAITGTTISGISASYKYTGKTVTPTVTIKNGTKKLVKNTDYTVTYKNNKAIGTATVTIKGKGNYSGTVTKTFSIIPKNVTVKSVTSPKTKQLKVTWTADKTITGYQVLYSTDSSFKSGNKTKTITKNTTTSATISSLTKGKTYYVRVRAYKTVNGTNIYGSYSTVKTVKIK